MSRTAITVQGRDDDAWGIIVYNFYSKCNKSKRYFHNKIHAITPAKTTKDELKALCNPKCAAKEAGLVEGVGVEELAMLRNVFWFGVAAYASVL